MRRTRWAILFRRTVGLILLAAMLTPAFGMAAGPYVAKPAAEETDWISPVYATLEDELKLTQSADWKTDGWTVEGGTEGGGTAMLFSYADEESGAFLGNYRAEYTVPAGKAGNESAMEALEGHLVPALNFIRTMRLTLEYRLAMSDSAVNGYFSARYSVRVPVFYSGEDDGVRVAVLPFYFVPQDESGALLTEYSRQTADGMIYLYLIRTEPDSGGEGRVRVTETLVADPELLGEIFPMVFEQMEMPELSDWLLRTPEAWRSERYFGGYVSAASLLGKWETEFGYNADLRTLEDPWYPMTLEVKADGTCVLTRSKAFDGVWTLQENTLRVEYDQERYLVFDAIDQHLYLTQVGDDGRILSVHRLKREGGTEHAFSINLSAAEPREEPEDGQEQEKDGPETADTEPGAENAEPEDGNGRPEETKQESGASALAENALTIRAEDGVTVLSSGQRVQLTALNPSGEQLTSGVSWTVTDLGGFDARNYATVNRRGVVTAKTLNRKVSVRVKATGSGLRGEIELTILPKLRRMTMDQTKVTLYLGAEEPVTVQVSATPEEAMPPKLVWTAADDLLTVQPAEDGTSAVLIPKKPGKTSVTVKDAKSRNSASARVTVIQPVTAVTIVGPAAVQRGKSVTYHVSLAPGNASDKTVTWSVDTQNSVAVVTSGGVLKVRKAAEPGMIIHLTCTAKGAGEPISQTIEVKVE